MAVLKPETVYFMAYMMVSDNNIYDIEWYELSRILSTCDEEVVNNTYKIIMDREDRITRDEVISALKQYPENEIITTVEHGMRLAYSDGRYTEEERDLFKYLASKLNIDERVIKGIEDKIIKENSREKNKRIKDNKDYINRYEKCLLADEDFIKSVDRIRKDSHTNVLFSKNVLESNIRRERTILTILKDEVKNRESSSLELSELTDDDIYNQFKDMNSAIKQIVDEGDEDLKGLLVTQEKTQEKFTITFMGRTKAGKSTLHSILLGGLNSEFIGQGQTRTTRYNYVYDWNDIRIVDTPGIGAPGGQKDTDIARSVSDESDLIIYVVTSDSIQETEFDFMAELKERNKPILILLNKKENFFRTEKKKEAFLNDPSGWRTSDEGKEELNGHITRIKTYIRNNLDFSEELIRIIPVHLLAARKSQEEDNPEVAEKFYEGSNIKELLDYICDTVKESGALRKAQTVYDGSVYHMMTYNDVVSEQLKAITKLREIYNSGWAKAISKIETESAIIEEKMIAAVNNEFNTFLNDEVNSFVNINYKVRKEQIIKEKWNTFIKGAKLDERIDARIKALTVEFETNVESIIKTYNEEFRFFMDSVDINAKLVTVTDYIFIMRLVNSAGVIVTGCFPPAAIIGAIVGTVVGEGLSLADKILMSSRGGKSREEYNQEKLFKAIKDGVEKSRWKTIKSVRDVIHDSLKRNLENIRLYQRRMVKTFDRISEKLADINGLQEGKIQELNEMYARNILNYMAEDPFLDLSENHDDGFVLNVNREYGKAMKIGIPYGVKIRLRKNEYSVEKVIQEKFRIMEE